MKTYFSNDFDLIAALKKGNTNGYSFLVNFYHKKLCVYAYSLTNDRDLAKILCKMYS